MDIFSFFVGFGVGLVAFYVFGLVLVAIAE